MRYCKILLFFDPLKLNWKEVLKIYLSSVYFKDYNRNIIFVCGDFIRVVLS